MAIIVDNPKLATMQFVDGKLIRNPGRKYVLSDGIIARGKKQVKYRLENMQKKITAKLINKKQEIIKKPNNTATELKEQIKHETILKKRYKNKKRQTEKALQELEKKKNNKWAEDIIHEICIMAKKEGQNVFNHLTQDNKLSKKYKSVKKAIVLLNQIRDGIFLDKCGELFTTLPEYVLESLRIDLIIKKIKQLEGNENAIRNVLLRCTKHYLMALSSDMDISEYIKKDYPITINRFLLGNNGFGNIKAYFMLFYYSSPLTDQQVLENIIVKIQNKSIQIYNMANDYTNKINQYNDSSKIRKIYWFNIYKLYFAFEQLKEENKTSYSIQSCFNIVFQNADKLYLQHGGVHKGSFALNSQTVKNAIKEISNAV